jgi:hypothetical protein
MADNDAERQPLLAEGPFDSRHDIHWGLYKPQYIWPLKLLLGMRGKPFRCSHSALGQNDCADAPAAGILLFLPRLLIALVTLVLVYAMCLIATAGAKIPFTPEDRVSC